LSSTPLKEEKRVPHFCCGIVERMADSFLDGHAKPNDLWSLQNRPLWVARRLFNASRLPWLNCMVRGQGNGIGFFTYAVCGV
jgi:hypothetical protein